MKSIKKIGAIISMMVIGIATVGCSNNATTANTNTNDTVTIKTTSGDVTVNKNPKNVATYDVAVLDLIQRFNVQVENLATPKMNVNYVKELVANKDTIGSLREPNFEALSTFKPDVIFASGRQQDKLEELQKIGKVAYFANNNNNAFERVIQDNTEIAKVFGVEDQLQQYKTTMETKIQAISEKAKASNKKALIIMTNEGKITAFGLDSRFGFIHTLFGFTPVDETIQASRHGADINYEYISKMNPDVIFYVDRNTVVPSKTNASAKTVLDNELVNATNAYKNNAIYELEAQYAYIAPNGLTAFEKMAEVIETAANK